MKRIFTTVALVLIVLTSACALPYPNQSPPVFGEGMPGPGVSMTQPAAAANASPAAAGSTEKIFLPGIIYRRDSASASEQLRRTGWLPGPGGYRPAYAPAASH